MKKQEELKEIIEIEILNYFKDTVLFLVDIKTHPTGKIEIFADGQMNNITIDECVKLSKHIYAFLEEKGLLTDNISLDVSSPGMDEPLKVKQQFQKQLHKKVDVVLKNGLKITGELIGFNENQIEVKETIKTKKIETTEDHIIAFEEIKSVKKHFNFKL